MKQGLKISSYEGKISKEKRTSVIEIKEDIDNKKENQIEILNNANTKNEVNIVEKILQQEDFKIEEEKISDYKNFSTQPFLGGPRPLGPSGQLWKG